MSQDLAGVRRSLIQVSSDLKQKKLLPAAKAVLFATKALIRMSLMKHEQEELTQMLSEACVLLQNNKDVRTIFPLTIAYAPKNEAALAATLEELIASLEEEATKGLQALQNRQRQAFDKGTSELLAGDHGAAKETFGAITREFSEDAVLLTNVGEVFLQHGLYEDASRYLSSASKLAPQSAHVLNRLGIALRKMGRFDFSEEKFRAALAIEDKDPNLYFNLGRLYLDAKQWQNCLKCAEAALKLDPSFTQASQMSAYCLRMLQEQHNA